MDLIEEEKIRQVAKNDRQFAVLMERKRDRDEKNQAKNVNAPPEFFQELAQRAAEFHRSRDIERRKREAALNLTEYQRRLRKRAGRREQKEKLAAWRESQIHQIEMDPQERQQLINQSRRESRELDRTIDDDLSESLEDWGFAGPETEQELD